MSVIQQLLRRWGFVKLNAYGLVLTPEGRVITTRPGVLDDGTGGKIVGWQEDDLAMTELRTWEPAKPAPAAVATPAPPAAIPPPAAYPQVISESAVMASVAPVSDMTEPAPEPVAEEDDWEWTIALARARAEAPVASPPAAAPRTRPPTPPPAKPARAGTSPITSRPAAQLTAVKPAAASASASASGKTTAIMPTVLPSATPATPAPVVAAAPSKPNLASAVTTRPGLRPVDPAASGEWPKTAPIGDIDYADPAQASTRTAIPAAAPPSPTVRHAATPPPPPVASTSAPLRGRPITAPPPSLPRVHTVPTPITVIPVPSLPTVSSSPAGGRLEPVVRSSAAPDPASARRLGKGTAPIDPDADDPAEPAAKAEMSDDTSVDLSVGDRTTPGIAMPIAARAVQLPSVKRRNAERR